MRWDFYTISGNFLEGSGVPGIDSAISVQRLQFAEVFCIFGGILGKNFTDSASTTIPRFTFFRISYLLKGHQKAPAYPERQLSSAPAKATGVKVQHQKRAGLPKNTRRSLSGLRGKSGAKPWYLIGKSASDTEWASSKAGEPEIPLRRLRTPCEGENGDHRAGGTSWPKGLNQT